LIILKFINNIGFLTEKNLYVKIKLFNFDRIFMSEKKDPYTLKWEKREEKRKEDVLKKMSLELDRKLP
jgi:hypothetical protein